MKTKLTLSITKDRVRRAKAISVRRKKSVSQLFEEFIDSLESPSLPKGKDSKKKYMIDRFAGTLTGKLSDPDLEEKARLEQVFRKRE